MPERIVLSRASGWRLPPSAVIVDRRTRWGNPWSAGDPGLCRCPSRQLIGWEHVAAMPRAFSAADAVAAFEEWLRFGRIAYPEGIGLSGPQYWREALGIRRRFILDGLPLLRRVDLGCWCALDAPCHARVLLDLVRELPE